MGAGGGKPRGKGSGRRQKRAREAVLSRWRESGAIAEKKSWNIASYFAMKKSTKGNEKTEKGEVTVVTASKRWGKREVPTPLGFDHFTMNIRFKKAVNLMSKN